MTVLARESDERYEATPEQEAELLASIAGADRDETVSAGGLLREALQLTTAASGASSRRGSLGSVRLTSAWRRGRRRS